MKSIFLSCFLVLLAAQSLIAQQQASILWARGQGYSGGYSVLLFSKSTHTVIGTSGSDWQSWPVKLNSLPIRSNASLFGSPFCAVSANGGDEIITGLGNGELWSWNPNSNNATLISQEASGGIQWIDATSDGKLIACCSSEEGILHVYDRIAGKDVIAWPNCVGSVSFSPDGKLLLAGFHNSLALIDVSTSKILHQYSNIVNNPMPVEFNPVIPGLFVVQDNYFWVMDTSGQVKAKLSIGTTDYNSTIAFSQSGKLLAISGTGPISILNMESFKLRQLGFGGGAVCFLGDDTIVSNASYNGTGIDLFSTVNSSLLCTLTSPSSYDLSIFPGGDALINLKRGCDISSGLLGPIVFPDGYPSRGDMVSGYSLHGSMAAGFQYYPKNGMCFWPSQSVAAISLDTIEDSICSAMAAFSPDSSIFAIAIHAGCSNGYGGHDIVKVFRTSDQEQLFNLTGPDSTITGFTFSHEGNLLGCSDGDSCFIWSMQDGNRVGTIGWKTPNIYWDVELIAFLPGDSSVLLRGYDFRKLNGARIRFVPDNDSGVFRNHTQIIRLPDNRYFGGFDYDYGEQWWQYMPDSIISFFDLEEGKVTNAVRVLEPRKELNLVVNPVTGDFAMGGQDLIYYKSIDPQRASVQTNRLHPSEIIAFAAQKHIKINLDDQAGTLYVYRSDGRCYYSEQTRPEIAQYATPQLPAGVYFIVFQSTTGERRFAKVSLFE